MGLLQMLPLMLLLGFAGAFAWVGYQMYVYSQGLAERGQRHMAKHNISFTKEGGMRVGVKEVKNDEYADKTQDFLVRTWNLSSWPAYKSMFWNKDAQEGIKEKEKAEKSHHSWSRSGSSSSVPTVNAASGAATSRPSNSRTSSSK